MQLSLILALFLSTGVSFGAPRFGDEYYKSLLGDSSPCGVCEQLRGARTLQLRCVVTEPATIFISSPVSKSISLEPGQEMSETFDSDSILSFEVSGGNCLPKLITVDYPDCVLGLYCTANLGKMDWMIYFSTFSILFGAIAYLVSRFVPIKVIVSGKAPATTKDQLDCLHSVSAPSLKIFLFCLLLSFILVCGALHVPSCTNNLKVSGNAPTVSTFVDYVGYLKHNGIFRCSGAVYGPSSVVTARHCFDTKLGLYEFCFEATSRFSGCHPVLNVSYAEEELDPYDGGDFAIATINVAYLPCVRISTPSVGDHCDVVGYGGLNSFSSSAQMASYILGPCSTLASLYTVSPDVTKVFCGLSVEAYRSTCHGDSGSPAFCTTLDGYSLAGILSFASECDRPSAVAAFSTVPSNKGSFVTNFPMSFQSSVAEVAYSAAVYYNVFNSASGALQPGRSASCVGVSMPVVFSYTTLLPRGTYLLPSSEKFLVPSPFTVALSSDGSLFALNRAYGTVDLCGDQCLQLPSCVASFSNASTCVLYASGNSSLPANAVTSCLPGSLFSYCSMRPFDGVVIGSVLSSRLISTLTAITPLTVSTSNFLYIWGGSPSTGWFSCGASLAHTLVNPVSFGATDLPGFSSTGVGKYDISFVSPTVGLFGNSSGLVGGSKFFIGTKVFVSVPYVNGSMWVPHCTVKVPVTLSSYTWRMILSNNFYDRNLFVPVLNGVPSFPNAYYCTSYVSSSFDLVLGLPDFSTGKSFLSRGVVYSVSASIGEFGYSAIAAISPSLSCSQHVVRRVGITIDGVFDVFSFSANFVGCVTIVSDISKVTRFNFFIIGAQLGDVMAVTLRQGALRCPCFYKDQDGVFRDVAGGKSAIMTLQSASSMVAVSSSGVNSQVMLADNMTPQSVLTGWVECMPFAFASTFISLLWLLILGAMTMSTFSFARRKRSCLAEVMVNRNAFGYAQTILNCPVGGDLFCCLDAVDGKPSLDVLHSEVQESVKRALRTHSCGTSRCNGCVKYNTNTCKCYKRNEHCCAYDRGACLSGGGTLYFLYIFIVFALTGLQVAYSAELGYTLGSPGLMPIPGVSYDADDIAGGSVPEFGSPVWALLERFGNTKRLFSAATVADYLSPPKLQGVSNPLLSSFLAGCPYYDKLSGYACGVQYSVADFNSLVDVPPLYGDSVRTYGGVFNSSCDTIGCSCDLSANTMEIPLIPNVAVRYEHRCGNTSVFSTIYSFGT